MALTKHFVFTGLEPQCLRYKHNLLEKLCQDNDYLFKSQTNAIAMRMVSEVIKLNSKREYNDFKQLHRLFIDYQQQQHIYIKLWKKKMSNPENKPKDILHCKASINTLKSYLGIAIESTLDIERYINLIYTFKNLGHLNMDSRTSSF